MHRVLTVLVSAVLLLAPSGASAQSVKPVDEDTVTISGKAYEFNHMDRFIAGATIKVRELPGVAAVTDAAGDYELTVPDNTTVTPYIDPPEGYNQIDLQTFHTRGKNIVNANFQTPADLEYNALAAILGVTFGPDGRPTDCVIVSTASARNVRGVDYQTFWDRTPHGVAGATATEFPEIAGPTYFNDLVIPDANQPSTSIDGGMIWTGVAPGAYRVATAAPTTRFASFLATCRPGRIVNANPPWGAYELTGDEKPLKAGVAAAEITSIRGFADSRERPRRVVAFIQASERVTGKLVLVRRGRVLSRERVEMSARTGVRLRIPKSKARGRGRILLRATFKDATGGKATETFPVTFLVPASGLL